MSSSSAYLGTIVGVDGPLVTVRLTSARRTSLFEHFYVDNDVEPTLVVIQRRGANELLCTYLSDGASVCERQRVTRSRPCTAQAVSPAIATRCVQALAPRGGTDALETGIKAVDLLAPFPRVGSVAMLGGHGVGRMAFVMELSRRVIDRAERLTVFFFVVGEDARGVAQMNDEEREFPSDHDRGLEFVWLPIDLAKEPSFCAEVPTDVRLYFTPLLACRGLMPAVDTTRSTSRLLTDSSVTLQHRRVAEDVRRYVADYERRIATPEFLECLALGALESAKRVAGTAQRGESECAIGRRLTSYLTQPFYVSERYTGLAGESVEIETTLGDCRQLMSDDSGQLDADDLYMKGRLPSSEPRPSQGAQDLRFWR